MDNVREAIVPVNVELPDSTIIKSTHEGELPIPSLPKEFRKADIFPDLQDTCLVSVGMLCDAGCEARFLKDQCVVTLKDEVIMIGARGQTLKVSR